MKISNKFFFLIFFSILILTPISSFIPTVLAVENTQILGVDLLSIDTGEFYDSTPEDSIRPLKSSVGGRDLLAFENLGMVSYDEDTKTAIYGGIITFGAEVNAYTAVLCEDAYPTSGGTDFDKITYRRFLSYQIWKHVNILDLPCSNPLSVKYAEKKTFGGQGDINYREIDFGDLYSHDYDGILPFEITMDTGLFLSKIGELEVGGQTFTVPKITTNFKGVKEVAKRGGEVGSYEDRFTGENEGIHNVSVEIIIAKPVWDSDITEVNDWFNEEMADALIIGDVPLPKDYPTIQQSVKDLTLTEYPTTGIQDSVTIPYKVHLQPELKKIPQTIALKYGHFHWWKCCQYYRQTPFVITNYYERIVGMHVYNVFVHTDFEIKVEVAMSCNFGAELSESFLDDPNLVISDRIWGGALYGAGDYKKVLPWEPSMWDWLIWILVIAIIGVGVYVAYKFYKISSKRKFMLKLAGRR